MNSTTKKQLTEKLLGIIKDKRLYITLLIIIAIIANIVFSPKKENTSSKKVSPTEKPYEYNLDFDKDINNNIKRNNEKSFLLNGHEVLENVIGFKWKENEIIYATNNGVYNLWRNQNIIKQEVETVIFPEDSDKIIYNNKEGVFILDLLNKQRTKIDNNIVNFKINNSGNYVISRDDNSLIIINTANNQTKRLEIGSIEIGFDWIINNNKFYTYNKNSNIVSIYDTDFQKTYEFTIESDNLFVDIDPLMQNIIIRNKNDIFIKNLLTNSLSKISIKEYEDYFIKWLSTDKILVVAKKSRGFLDLYDQDLYLVKNRNIEYLTSSLPIKGKISTTIQPKINKDNTAIAILENNGKIWTISLIPNKLPSLTESGINFYDIPSIKKEDSH